MVKLLRSVTYILHFVPVPSVGPPVYHRLLLLFFFFKYPELFGEFNDMVQHLPKLTHLKL